MKEQLISFDTAKLAKEKGFNIWTEYQYVERNGNIIVSKDHISEIDEPAPTQSLLQKWLREVHNIHIEIRKEWEDGIYLGFEYLIEEEDGNTQGLTYKTYEEALEVGLYQALK